MQLELSWRAGRSAEAGFLSGLEVSRAHNYNG
jgi:hypothetical protein